MNDVIYYERREEMFEIDELIERHKIRSSETCFALDEIERVLNKKDEEILYLKNANNHNNDISAGKIQKLESELKKRDNLLREAVKYLYLGKKQFARNTTNSDVDYFLSKPEIKKILENK